MRGRSIDAASFTALRLLAGALVLALLAAWTFRRSPALRRGGSARSALALFAYAIAFSFAYLELPSGVGALLLFGAVQLTMLVGGFLAGQRPTAFDGVGIALALAGLAWLTLPATAAAPPSWAAAGMASAGVAWGIYSLRGRSERVPPLAATAGNFVRSVPLALGAVLVAALASPLHVTPRGVTLALLSGALTSGLGYVVWYAALPGLRAAQAGLVQLAVPVLTALGGVLFLAERFTVRLGVSSVLVLGGIAVALLAGARRVGGRS